MAVKVSAAKFVAFLEERRKAKDGYIMGATGQDPKKWLATSWWITQYKGSQRAKALHWRKNAERVWDCNGLFEGYYQQMTGVNINARARNNYASWCDPKGKGVIPAKYRVHGAAVFKANLVGTIHHVGYLIAPVSATNPAGDWYIDEAKGVMYGVIKSRLSDGGWNRWGLMTKYCDYATAPVVVPTDPAMPPVPAESYKCNWVVANNDVNVRSGPGSQYKSCAVLHKNIGLVFDGAIQGAWIAVWWYGKRCWVHSSYVQFEVREKPIIDISKYNGVVKDWNVLAGEISYAWLRIGARVATSSGVLLKDSAFDRNAKAMELRGVPFGAYFYGRAKTVAGAIAEAKAVLKWINPYKPTTIVYDAETATNTHEAVQAFIDTIEASGIRCGVYVGRRWRQIKADKLKCAFRWGPYYGPGGGVHGRNPTNFYNFHQFTSAYKFKGIYGHVDASHVHGPYTIVQLRSGFRG